MQVSYFQIAIITLHRVIKVRYDAILHQSEHAHLYNQLNNYTNGISSFEVIS